MATGFYKYVVLCIFYLIFSKTLSLAFANGSHYSVDRFSRSREYYEKFNKAGVYTKAAMACSQSQFLRSQPSSHDFNKIFRELNFNNKDMLSSFETISKSKHSSQIAADSSKCIEDIGKIIISFIFGDSWAIPFLDATGKPGPSITKGWLNFIGNYEQCQEASAPNTNESAGFKGRYCSLPIILTGIPLPTPPNIGLCLPDSCSEHDISPIFQRFLTALNITTVSVANLQCHIGKTEISSWTITAILILCIIGFLVIYGTLYDYMYLQRKDSYDLMKGDMNGATEPSNSDVIDEKTNLLPNVDITHSSGYSNTLIKFFVCFSLYTNGKKLLNTVSPPGSIGSIHGIRFISMSWVILGHCFVVGGLGFSINFTTGIQTFLQRWTFTAIGNALVSVDTFFTLSGFLTSYLYVKELIRKDGPRKINWVIYYFHRVWRLTPQYIIAIVLYVGLQQYMGSGALWPDVEPNDKEMCEKRWWTNMLYINNFVYANPAPCFAHTWYLANEMQFFLLSPLMVIPFYYHWAAGLSSCTILLLISWIVTGVLSTQHDWYTTILGIAMSDAFIDYYIKPWCRIGPYIIGVIAGYILVLTQGKRFKLKWWYVLIGWLIATASALAVLYGSYGELSGTHIPNTSTRALYNTVSRSVWGACVCWVILACTWGYGGPVNTFLSWSPFMVLGRLTYCTYLTHFNLLYIFFANMGLMFYLNNTTIAIIFLGLVFFCNAVGFVFTLLFESPFLGIEKAFLRK